MKTWKEISDPLEGVSAGVLAEIKKLTGPARHRARVNATKAAAIAVASEDNGDPRPLRVAAILLADTAGVGGPGGTGHLLHEGSGGTLRPLLGGCGLGSGRWQAGDGEAYRAAAKQALKEVLREADPEGHSFPVVVPCVEAGAAALQMGEDWALILSSALVRACVSKVAVGDRYLREVSWDGDILEIRGDLQEWASTLEILRQEELETSKASAEEEAFEEDLALTEFRARCARDEADRLAHPENWSPDGRVEIIHRQPSGL